MKTRHQLQGHSPRRFSTFAAGTLLFLLASNLHASLLLVTIEQTPDPTTSLIFNGGSVSNLGTLTWTIATDTTNPDLNPTDGVGTFALSSVTLLAPGLGINTATAVTSSGLAYYTFGPQYPLTELVLFTAIPEVGLSPGRGS